jgi:3-methyladenine DNA glycosylase AlkD
VSFKQNMNTAQAREFGIKLSELVHQGNPQEAYNQLAVVLDEHIKFSLLERIAAPIGTGPLESSNTFLEIVAQGATEGGYVIIGGILREQLNRDLPGAFRRARGNIANAQVWYATDILGERVPGQGLVDQFETGLAQLEDWRKDSSPWVRRAVGVAVHFWAKRSQGAADLEPRAVRLMDFLEPLVPDWDIEATKGTGWGLKTLGKYYPEALTSWLKNILPQQPRYRTLLQQKAFTYLSEKQRERVLQQLKGEV